MMYNTSQRNATKTDYEPTSIDKMYYKKKHGVPTAQELPWFRENRFRARDGFQNFIGTVWARFDRTCCPKGVFLKT